MRLITYLVMLMSIIGCAKKNYPSKIIDSGDTFIDSLFADSKLIVMSNTTSAWNYSGWKHTCLIRKRSKWKLITFEMRGYKLPGMRLPFNYSETLIKKNLGDSIYKIFKLNNFLKIPSINEGCDTSELHKNSKGKFIFCNRNDVATYHIYIKTKGEITKKSYRDIFFNNECCPGNKDRQTFIKCYNALNSF